MYDLDGPLALKVADRNNTRITLGPLEFMNLSLLQMPALEHRFPITNSPDMNLGKVDLKVLAKISTRNILFVLRNLKSRYGVLVVSVVFLDVYLVVE
jgi:hypothetical protein